MSAREFPPAVCVVVTIRIPQPVPLHPLPESDQLRLLEGLDPGTGVSVATTACVALVCTDDGALSCSVKLLVIVTLDEFLREGSAALVAVTVTLAGLGRICGAVYFPLASIVPQLAGQAAPLSDHRIVASGCPALVTEA